MISDSFGFVCVVFASLAILGDRALADQSYAPSWPPLRPSPRWSSSCKRTDGCSSWVCGSGPGSVPPGSTSSYGGHPGGPPANAVPQGGPYGPPRGHISSQGPPPGQPGVAGQAAPPHVKGGPMGMGGLGVSAGGLMKGANNSSVSQAPHVGAPPASRPTDMASAMIPGSPSTMSDSSRWLARQASADLASSLVLPSPTSTTAALKSTLQHGIDWFSEQPCFLYLSSSF